MSIQLVAARLHGEEVAILSSDGHWHEGVLVSLSSYGVSYRVSTTDSTVRVPIKSTVCIKHVNSKVGTAAPLGGLAGCVIGSAIGLAAYPPPEEGFIVIHSGVVYAGIGILAGLASGTVLGLTAVDAYEFPQQGSVGDTAKGPETIMR